MSNYQNLYVLLIIAYVFCSTKLEKRAEQVLPGRKGGGAKWEGVGKGDGGKGEKWLKQCMHI
jgi:hypothetical protein